MSRPTRPPASGSTTRPPASSPEALRRMQRQRRVDTGCEIAIRRLLWARGWRYRVDYRLPLTGLRRRADIAFPGRKVAVFVDGCYWHSCPQHGTRPAANADWWRDKLARNVERDRDTDIRLGQAGWISVRIWEHEAPEEAVEKITRVLRAERS